MPTGTSTIFGAFQAIDFSPRYGANADGTPISFSPSEQLRNIPVGSDLTVDVRAANLIAINFWLNLDRLRGRHRSESHRLLDDVKVDHAYL